MMEIPRSPVFERNQRIYGSTGSAQCIVCNRPVNAETHRLWVRIFEGCYICTAAEAEAGDPAGDTGYYPVGKECIKRFPEIKPYVEVHK